MTYTKSRKGVLQRFDDTTQSVQDYFWCAQDLLRDDYPFEVVLAWMFSRLELAHNMTIYCGIVKLHRCDSTVTRNILDTHHMNRQGFRTLFNIVFGKPLEKELKDTLAVAERVRNRSIHGKRVEDAEHRRAIVSVIEYAERLNTYVYELAGFQPFGDLRGFKGRGQSLDATTTRWVLRGMGIAKGTELKTADYVGE